MYLNRLSSLLVCAAIIHTPAFAGSESEEKTQQTQQQTQNEPQENQGNHYAQLRPRMRGADAPDELWDIAIENDDLFTFCYSTTHKVRLWRAEPKHQQTLHLKNRDQQQEIDLEWPVKAQEIEWPQTELSLLNNKMYVVEFTNAEQQPITRVLRFHAVPTGFGKLNLTGQLAYLRAQGCLVQAQWLEAQALQ